MREGGLGSDVSNHLQHSIESGINVLLTPCLSFKLGSDKGNVSGNTQESQEIDRASPVDIIFREESTHCMWLKHDEAALA